MAKATQKEKESSTEIEPRSFTSFLGGDVKLDDIRAEQKADKHGNPVKTIRFRFSGSFDLKDEKEEVIDSIELKLSIKTGPKGMDRAKEITTVQAIHQYAKLILLPSEYRDMDLNKELTKENTLDQFFRS